MKCDKSGSKINVAGIVVILGLMMIATTPAAQAGVWPPGSSTQYGNTYGEWSASWIQWLLSIPAATNPALDTTGANCGVGQSGPVWFLAGTFGTSETRNCTIPAGKSLFFPILNGFFGAGVFDCFPTIPKVACLLPTLRAAAAASMDSVTLQAELDGAPLVPAGSLSDFRVRSPEFAITFPDGNVYGLKRAGNVQRGTYLPNVADGYWVMLLPLSPGPHTLHFKGTSTGGVFEGAVIEATYHLTQQ